jgi:drug/metabolite transporter (DMT)-like permease
MNARSIRIGIGLAIATAVISGVAVFLNSYAVKALPDAALFTTLKNGVAALILFGLALPMTRPSQLVAVSRRQWLGVLVLGVFGGGVAFLLFFTGLALASAPSAAFIHKTLFVWVALLAVPLLGERLGWVQIGALALLIASQLLIVPPTGVVWGSGETMIAAATLIWAVEVIIARRLLAQVPPMVLGVARLGVGLVVLAGYVVVTGRLEALAGVTAVGWLWVAVTGVLLAGYVGTWLAALRAAPATVVTSVLVLGAPITALLAGAVSGALPAPPALAGYGLVIAAVVLLSGAALLAHHRQARMVEA